MNIAADGSFGPDTYSAVIQYQNKNGLPATGIVDAKTRAKMNGI
jgi:peptidoglycan hydrolase-like protein with peptidoglycan-binding domain